MTTTPLSSWGKWQQTRNTLLTALALNVAARNATVGGSPEEAAYNTNIDQIFRDMKDHALNGLRMVDLEIADQNLVARISQQSEEAKKEADRLKKAAADVDKLTKFVGKLTKLVTSFSGL